MKYVSEFETEKKAYDVAKKIVTTGTDFALLATAISIVNKLVPRKRLIGRLSNFWAAMMIEAVIMDKLVKPWLEEVPYKKVDERNKEKWKEDYGYFDEDDLDEDEED